MDFWIKIIFLINFIISLHAAKISECKDSVDPNSCFTCILNDTTKEILKKIDRLQEMQMNNDKNVEALKQENKNMSEELEALKKENTNLREVLENTNIEVKSLNEKNRQLSDSFGSYKAEIDALFSTKMENLQSNQDHIEDKIEDIKVETSTSIKDTENNFTSLYNNIQIEVEKTKDEVKCMNESLQSFKAEIEASVSTSVEDLKAKHEDENKNITMGIKSMNDSFESFKAEFEASVSTRVEDLKAKHEDLLSNLNESTEANKNITSTISILQDNLTAKHKELYTSAIVLNRKLQELQSAKKEHLEKIQVLSSHLSKTKEDYEEKIKILHDKVLPCGEIGWTYSASLGSCYIQLENKLSWQEARDKCRSLAGHGETSDLVSIQSQQENELVQGMLKNFDVWIGLSDIGTDDSFQQWSDGSQVGFTDWRSSQPDYQYGKKDCVDMRTPFLQWYTYDCLEEQAAVCKKKILG